MKKLEYNNYLKKFARENRSKGTKGEAILWKYVLRAKHTGYQFNRQYIIGNFIVDFICRKLSLIIEIDGSSHYGLKKEEEDFLREQWLREKGYEILRITEGEVVKRLDDVVVKITDAIHSIEQSKKIL